MKFEWHIVSFELQATLMEQIIGISGGILPRLAVKAMSWDRLFSLLKTIKQLATLGSHRPMIVHDIGQSANGLKSQVNRASILARREVPNSLLGLLVLVLVRRGLYWHEKILNIMRLGIMGVVLKCCDMWSTLWEMYLKILHLFPLMLPL